MLQVVTASEEDANAVREAAQKLLDQYEYLTVGDLRDLVGLSSTFTDQKIGWSELKDVQIKAVAEGFALELPDPTPLDR